MQSCGAMNRGEKNVLLPIVVPVVAKQFNSISSASASASSGAFLVSGDEIVLPFPQSFLNKNLVSTRCFGIISQHKKIINIFASQ
jgi:hypothetical protein